MRILRYIRNSRMATSGNFFAQIQKKLGIKISNNHVYKEAFTHSYVNLKNPEGSSINFERLEFLGDAILTSVIAEYLYNFYPQAKEGALTKLRAKIVSRVKLNQIGKKMGLLDLANISTNHKHFGEDIHGNLLESVIGAIFVDKGYNKTKTYVINNIIHPYIDMNKLDSLVLSHKAFLIEWSQKEKKELQFVTQETGGVNPRINYSSQILLNNEVLAKSKALSKKKAEEKAAKIATRILKLNPNPTQS